MQNQQQSMSPDVLPVVAGAPRDLIRDAQLLRSWRDTVRSLARCYKYAAECAKTPVARVMFEHAAAKQESILADLEDALRVIRKRMGEIRFAPEAGA